MTQAMAAARQYTALGAHTRSNRDLEYEVILGVTRDMKKAGADPMRDFPRFVAVLNKNERLWTEIGIQVADPENALDKKLRAGLFYMAEFVTHQTGKVLKSQADITSLIEVNVAVLRGLKGEAR